jgi:hypothetical protein
VKPKKGKYHQAGVSLPATLYERFKNRKDRRNFNLSRICSEALERELDGKNNVLERIEERLRRIEERLAIEGGEGAQ